MHRKLLPSDDLGFALISALVMAIIIGGLLISVQMLVRNIAVQSSDVSDEAELRASLTAGLNRMIYAFATADDPLRAALVPDGRAVFWQFQHRGLTLRAQAESGKWDLNSGDRDQIASLLRRLADDPGLQSRAMGIIDNARSRRVRLESVATVLTPLERMTERRKLFEDHFTVATDQIGIDPLAASPETLDAITELSESMRQELLRARSAGRGYPDDISSSVTRLFVGEKPVYTFRAETAEGFRRAGAMEAVVGFSEQGSISIFSWARTGMSSEPANDIPQHGRPTSAALSPP